MLPILIACGGGDADEPAPAATRAPTSRPISQPSPTPTVRPHPTEMPAPDPSATAQATGCDMTAYATGIPPKDAENGAMDLAATKWVYGDGLWVGPDPAFGGRWYAGGLFVVWYSDTPGDLSVTGERLDGKADPLRTQYSYTNPEDYGAIFNELYFPEAGCWNVSATMGTSSVEFVVYVQPLGERPDVQEQLAAREALRPFSAPGDCPITPTDGFEFQQYSQFDAPLVVTISGDGMQLRGSLDFLFEGENALAFVPEEWSEPMVTGQLVDDPSTTLRATGIRSAGTFGDYWRATVLFPASGCWQIHAESDDQVLDATVFVYPADCHVEPGHDSVSPCKTPEP